MARTVADLTIYGQMTDPLPPGERRPNKVHFVTENEDPVGIANYVYSNQSYDPDGWRRILEANGIEDPFRLDQDFAGKLIIIPDPPVPEFNR